MTIGWMAVVEIGPKKYENRILRQTEMNLPEVLEEIYPALEKLKYQIFLIKDQSVSLLRYDPKESKDISLIVIVGKPEEIRAIQLDERVKKKFK